ncbi:MAG TPA: ion transporter, partial [Oceanospirillales bacterium]|nr:ion transporter [Oceanospirillales bacterium]
MQKANMPLRKKIFMILERESHSKFAEFVHYLLMALILLTVISVILESDESIYQKHRLFFWLIEAISLTGFSIEYVLRVWSSG